MKKFYMVNVMNRFDNDHIAYVKYFTTIEKANAYATKVNKEYTDAALREDYGKMVYHVDETYGIKELKVDEEEA